MTNDFQKTPNMSVAWIWYIVSFLVVGCSMNSNSDPLISRSSDEQHFIYLSHIRLDTNDGIYSKIYDIDFSNYNYKLLGGDLAPISFKDENIQNHLDSILDLKNKNTLWSIGNHDNTSNKRFRKFTNKNKYGIYQSQDVSFIVLNSQDSLGSIVGRQKEFFFNALDTLSSKKIIFMSHKLIFMDQHPQMDGLINVVCNGRKGSCNYCHNSNNFMSEIYPRLKELRQDGKEILWIGGDLGKKVTKFEYVDDSGIIFLGNGVWYKKKNNAVLLLRNSKKLTYNFVDIDTLLKYQHRDDFEKLFDTAEP